MNFAGTIIKFRRCYDEGDSLFELHWALSTLVMFTRFIQGSPHLKDIEDGKKYLSKVAFQFTGLRLSRIKAVYNRWFLSDGTLAKTRDLLQLALLFVQLLLCQV